MRKCVHRGGDICPGGPCSSPEAAPGAPVSRHSNIPPASLSRCLAQMQLSHMLKGVCLSSLPLHQAAASRQGPARSPDHSLAAGPASRRESGEGQPPPEPTAPWLGDPCPEGRTAMQREEGRVVLLLVRKPVQICAHCSSSAIKVCTLQFGPQTDPVLCVTEDRDTSHAHTP